MELERRVSVDMSGVDGPEAEEVDDWEVVRDDEVSELMVPDARIEQP